MKLIASVDGAHAKRLQRTHDAPLDLFITTYSFMDSSVSNVGQRPREASALLKDMISIGITASKYRAIVSTLRLVDHVPLDHGCGASR